MSLLEDAFYALDTPGAYARGALSGRLGKRASGEDVLRAWGVNDPNKWAGIAAEMVLDPINLIPGGLGLKALRGVKTAKAANKATRIMVRKGAMPAELAASTLVGKGGKPTALYHGTQFPFDKVDLSKADPQAIYGPGFYNTVDPKIASGYADTKMGPAVLPAAERSPHVRKSFMHSKKVFDVDSNLAPDDLKRIIKVMREKGYPDVAGKLEDDFKVALRPPKDKSVSFSNPKKQDIYNALGDRLYAWTTPNGRDTINGILRKAGYDSIKHVGGKLTSTAHDVHIGLLGESQMFKPWVAPAMRKIPRPGRQIGLLAAGAGGYQAGRIGLRPEPQIGLRP